MILFIRRVIPEEADRLSQIAYEAKAHWGYPVRWLEIWKPQLTFEAGYFRENESWAGVIDETPIAFYTLQEKGDAAWLDNLWVLPECIGRGFGRQLFLHALNRARELGRTVLQLEADPNAVGFYEKMGMRKIGEHHSEVDGHPRILPIMESKL